MKTRLALWAVTAVTAISMAGALQAAFGLSGDRAIHSIGANAPVIARFALGYEQTIIIVNLAASALLLIWWLTATAKPTPRPTLRLANAAFGSWILVQMLVIWTAVLGILQQVSGLPDGEPVQAALLIIGASSLRWLIPSTFFLPILQLGLGEWAYRVTAQVTHPQGVGTIALTEAG